MTGCPKLLPKVVQLGETRPVVCLLALQEDLKGVLQKITCPFFVITGSEDFAPNPANEAIRYYNEVGSKVKAVKVIEPGWVVTLKPNIVSQDKRISLSVGDTVVVTPNGARRLGTRALEPIITA